MSGVEVILAALAAGMAAGAKDTAATAIGDAYATLRELARRRLAGRPHAQQVLEATAQPSERQEHLRTELISAGADRDEELLMAARRLLELSDPSGTWISKYRVNASDGQGVQVGDHNLQLNTFS